MDDLKRKRQELDQEVWRIPQELKQLRRQGRSAGRLQVSAGQRNAARALMAMREGEPTAAMAFLKSKRKAADPDATGWVDVETELQAWWDSADDDAKRAHTQICEANRQLHGAIKQAQRFMVDEELEAWVADQNVGKGINPVPANTLREAAAVKGRIGVDALNTHRGARQWMRRWRQSRGLRLHKNPAIEPLEKKDSYGEASAQVDTKITALFLFYTPPDAS